MAVGGDSFGRGRLHRGAPALSWARTAAVGAVALAAVVGVGCGTPAGPGVEPLGSGTTASSPARHDTATGAHGPDTAVTPPPAPADPATGSAPPSSATTDDAVHSELRTLLQAYGEALTRLAASPQVVGDASHPLVQQWHAVVLPGTPLDVEVRARLESDLRNDGVRVVPVDHGVSWVHRAVGPPTDTGDAAVRFEHCGWSPGVVVDATTGDVVDDRVSVTQGHGIARRDASGALRIVDLVDDHLEWHPAGTADPCPDDATTAGSGAGP